MGDGMDGEVDAALAAVARRLAALEAYRRGADEAGKAQAAAIEALTERVDALHPADIARAILDAPIRPPTGHTRLVTLGADGRCRQCGWVGQAKALHHCPDRLPDDDDAQLDPLPGPVAAVDARTWKSEYPIMESRVTRPPDADAVVNAIHGLAWAAEEVDRQEDGLDLAERADALAAWATAQAAAIRERAERDRRLAALCADARAQANIATASAERAESLLRDGYAEAAARWMARAGTTANSAFLAASSAAAELDGAPEPEPLYDAASDGAS